MIAANPTHYEIRTVTESVPGATAEEHRLIDLAAGGDQRAFETLYHQHVGRIYAVCLRMTANVARAEECTQLAFVRAWRKLGGFQKRSKLSSWLHRIAVNEVLGLQRSDTRLQRHLSSVEPDDDRVAADGRPHRIDHEIDLEQAIGELPEGARHVFVLYAVYGFTHEEAGKTLGIAAGTCKAQLHRARRLLRGRLE